MTIEDGAVGTLINGVRQPIKLTKLTTTAPPADQDAEPATETFALRPDTGQGQARQCDHPITGANGAARGPTRRIAAGQTAQPGARLTAESKAGCEWPRCFTSLFAVPAPLPATTRMLCADDR